MRTPSPLYDHLFKGKKMAGMAGEIRQLWLAPRSPHESPLERATQELQVCRRLRAYYEVILNREAARLTSFTRGMCSCCAWRSEPPRTSPPLRGLC